MLEEEVAFFNANRADWLQKQQNRVALIKERELIGMFDTEEQAIMEGGARFGMKPFLVKRVLPTDSEFTAPALALGILGANSQFSNDRQGHGSDGKPAIISPQASLTLLGPRLQVTVGLANAFAEQVL